jgi:hypothetical protein
VQKNGCNGHQIKLIRIQTWYKLIIAPKSIINTNQLTPGTSKYNQRKRGRKSKYLDVATALLRRQPRPYIPLPSFFLASGCYVDNSHCHGLQACHHHS